MSGDRRELHSDLAQARQELQIVQARVAELEARLSEAQPDVESYQEMASHSEQRFQKLVERRQAEEQGSKVNRTLAMLSEVNQAIIRLRQMPELFQKVCHIAIEQGGFGMAWIGLFDAKTRRVNPVAHAGAAVSTLDNLAIALDDESDDPAASVLRDGHHVIVNNIEHNPNEASWREDALR